MTLLGGLLLSLTVGAAATLSMFLKQSSFIWDDFVNARIAQQEGMSVGYLFRPDFGHISPGFKFVCWLFQRMAPLDFRLPVFFLVACFALSLLVLHRLLSELFRPSWGTLAVTVAYAFSVAHVGTGLWWAAALGRFPATLFGLGSVLAYVRFRRSEAWKTLAASVGLLTVGLAFAEETIFYLLMLILVEVLVLTPAAGGPPAWRAWLPYLLPVTLLAIAAMANPEGGLYLASVGDLHEYFSYTWFKVFAPALLGFQLPLSPSAADRMVVILSQIVVAGVVIWSLIRRRTAWRAWVLFAIVFFVSELPAPLVRGIDAPALATAYRYHMVSLTAFTLALALAFLPLRPTLTRAREPVRLHRARLDLGYVVVAVALVAYVANSIAGSSQYLHVFTFAKLNKSYVTALLRSVAEVERSGPGTGLLDSDVPPTVVPPQFLPFNRLSMVAGLTNRRLTFSTRAPRLVQITATGNVEPVRFRIVLEGNAAELRMTGKLTVPAELEPAIENRHVCLRTPASLTPITYTFPRSLEPGNWYVRLTATSDRAGTALIGTSNGSGWVPAPEWGMPLLEGHTDNVSRLGLEQPTGVQITLPAQTRICLSEITIARVEPA